MNLDRRNLRRRSTTKRSILLTLCFRGSGYCCLVYVAVLAISVYLRSLTTQQNEPSLLFLERFMYGNNNDTVTKEIPSDVPIESDKTININYGLITMVVEAFDEMGRPGYIADPTSIRRQYQRRIQSIETETNTSLTSSHDNNINTSLLMSWAVEVCDLAPGLAEEGPEGAQGLWKIRQGLPPTHRHNHFLPSAIKQSQSSHPRILCLVYTHSNRHETALRAIVDTWGVDCHGFLALSNQTDESLGAVHVGHPGPETYKNMWQKVRFGWMYVYQHYRNDYDWFHIGGDDHYVIVPNLKRLALSLSSSGKQEPIYMGSSMVDYKIRDRFCGGGAGYTLNRQALSVLADVLPTCFAETTTSEEDRCVGRCLLHHNARRRYNYSDAPPQKQERLSQQQKIPGAIWCRNTNDDWDEQRYHALDIAFHSTYYKDRKVPWDAKALKRKHNISSTQIGLKQISNTSISFHLPSSMVESRHADRGIRRYHALLYGACGPQMDLQLQKVARYNTTFLSQHVAPSYRKYKEIWSDLRDKCAEVIINRGRDLTGNTARQYCSRAARQRKMKRLQKYHPTNITNIVAA